MSHHHLGIALGFVGGLILGVVLVFAVRFVRRWIEHWPGPPPPKRVWDPESGYWETLPWYEEVTYLLVIVAFGAVWVLVGMKVFGS